MLNIFFHGFYTMVNILGHVLFIFNYFVETRKPNIFQFKKCDGERN